MVLNLEAMSFYYKFHLAAAELGVAGESSYSWP